MSFVRSSYLFILGAVACFAQTTPATANITQTTGTVGIAEGETARLSLVNPGTVPPAAPTSCTATIMYINPASAIIKLTTVNIPPGQSMSLDLHSDTDLHLASGQRAQIRGVITTMVSASTGGTTACVLVPTLEIFDSTTGRTQVVLTQTQTVP